MMNNGKLVSKEPGPVHLKLGLAAMLFLLGLELLLRGVFALPAWVLAATTAFVLVISVVASVVASSSVTSGAPSEGLQPESERNAYPG
jgi:predicted tellurium resistance membrane protein TerC